MARTRKPLRRPIDAGEFWDSVLEEKYDTSRPWESAPHESRPRWGAVAILAALAWAATIGFLAGVSVWP